MSHHCQSCLITCEDFRLHQRADGRNYIAEFIKNLAVDCDLITRGGGVQDLVRPPHDGFGDCCLRDTEVSIKLHQSDVVYLVNHEDCGAYEGMHFDNREEELKQHRKDLQDAKEIILKKFPQKEVKLFFGYLKEGTDDQFEIKEV